LQRGPLAVPNTGGSPELPQTDEAHMLAWLKTHRDRQRTARSVYGSIVTQARRQAFYARWGVPDSVQGRFEMVVLHVALVHARLAAEDAAGRDLAQAVSEAFVVDMDDIMREMTFGDLTVPREVKRAAAALYDRHTAYLAALAEPDNISLQRAILAQMAYLGAGARLDAGELARYVREAAGGLAAQPSDAVLAGQLAWPEPADAGD